MRGGANTNCSVHQTLTSEAASVLKQSLGLARRRGHAQVTPLHVAFTLLSSRASDLLRRACLKSQPPLQLASHHPLQCRALELCFNVALNRLPTITTNPAAASGSPLLHHAHHQQPSLSNALVAALKRAQAHQRRGCIEQQQQQQQQQNQPLLAAKVELEQLVLSILDDPSVSRVMREAGFSSTAVKAHIEDSLSSSSVFQYHTGSVSGVYSSPASPTGTKDQPNCFWPTQCFFSHANNYSDQNPLLFYPYKNSTNNSNSNSSISLKEDVKLVLDVMVRKKRSNTVIVGDSGHAAEPLVWELKDTLQKGDYRLPPELKTARFIRLRFEPEALKLMKREDVEVNYLKELRGKLVESSLEINNKGTSGGTIIYVGDLKWAVSSLSDTSDDSDGVDYLVKELGRMVNNNNYHSYKDNGRSTRVWLVATSSLQTYMKCQMKQPPLDVQWGLQPVSVPSGGLGLSLHASSLNDPIIPFLKIPSSKGDEEKLSCCGECTSNYEQEAGLCKSSQNKLQLPSWLQSQNTNNVRHEDELVELRRKWNRLCQSLHQGIRQTKPLYSTQSPTSKQLWSSHSNSLLFPDTSSISFALPGFRRPGISNSIPRFRRQNSCTIEFESPNLSSLKKTEGRELKITLALGNNDSVGEKLVEDSIERTRQRANVCRVLKDYIPWQSENVPGIADALLDKNNKDIWILIQGNDHIGKIRLASGIAKSMYGTGGSVLHLKMGVRDGLEAPSHEVLTKVLGNDLNNDIVVLVEDFDLGGTRILKLLADRFDSGGDSAHLTGRMIFLLTMSDSTGNDIGGNLNATIPMVLKLYEGCSPFNKRKAEEEFLSRMKNPRIALSDEVTSVTVKKDFSRQSSFNSLDLNIRAEDQEDLVESTDVSPVSSDLTRENMGETQSPCDQLLESIKNRFFFNRSPVRDKEMREAIGSKIKVAFEEVYGGGTGTVGGGHNNKVVNFGIEDRVLERVLLEGGDSFVNNVFERWLTDIFQATLERGKLINMGNGISLRLCVGDKGEGNLGEGFLGTNLPDNILVSISTND